MSDLFRPIAIIAFLLAAFIITLVLATWLAEDILLRGIVSAGVLIIFGSLASVLSIEADEDDE